MLSNFVRQGIADLAVSLAEAQMKLRKSSLHEGYSCVSCSGKTC